MASGCTFEVAAGYVGIAERTLHRWMRLGRKKDAGIYRQFRQAAKRALAQAEMRDVLIIAKAAERHWQAAAWRLERRWPDRWGRVNREKAIEASKQHTPEEYAAAIGRMTQLMQATIPDAPPAEEAKS